MANFFKSPELEVPAIRNLSAFKALMRVTVIAPVMITVGLLIFLGLYHPNHGLLFGLVIGGFMVTIGLTWLTRHLLNSLADTFQLSQAHLKQSEEHFRLLANSIPDLVSVASGEGKALWYNEAWYRYTGSSPNERADINWRHVHHPDTFPLVFEKWKSALETGEGFEIQFPLRGKDGAFRRFLYRATPIKDHKERVVFWFGTSTDIEAEINQNEILKEALQTRDDFISVASHELKTPLTALQLQCQLLERQLKVGSVVQTESAQAVSFCGDQIHKINQLINQLFDITQIRIGKLQLNKTNSDLAYHVSEVCKRFQSQAKAQGIQFDWKCPEGVVGHWDSVRIEQVVSNLISNALKYGNGKPVWVQVKPLKEQNQAQILVKDQGVGICEPQKHKIFERFSRGSTGAQTRGLGLGLYICRQLVEAHGGRIEVKSEIGIGSEFTVTLPL